MKENKEGDKDNIYTYGAGCIRMHFEAFKRKRGYEVTIQA
jgi:hypothetical protein